MPRYLPIQLDAANPEVKAEYNRVEAALGFVPNFIKTVAHSPHYLSAVSELYLRAMSEESALGDKLRLLVILRSCQLDRCKQTFDFHRELALRAGVSPEKIEALPDAEASDLFDFYERDALLLVQHLHANPDDIPQDKYWTQLDNHFTSDQVIELITLVGIFGLIDRLVLSLQVQPDPEPAGVG